MSLKTIMIKFERN